MTAQVRPKEFRFPVETVWESGRRTVTRVAGKEPLMIAPPPEFKGTDPTVWSPEDAFVTAASSCLAVTITGMVQREELPMHALAVRAEGVAGRRSDGHFGFTRIEQTVELTTAPGYEDAARALVEKAHDTCLVTVSLDLPVETAIEIAVREAAA